MLLNNLSDIQENQLLKPVISKKNCLIIFSPYTCDFNDQIFLTNAFN